MILVCQEHFFRPKEHNAIVYCFSEWMPKIVRSHMFKILSILEKEIDVPIYYLDSDNYKSFIVDFEVKVVPTLVIFKNKAVAKKVEGSVYLSNLRPIIRSIFKKNGEENV